MDPRIPLYLQPALSDYLDQLRTRLPGAIGAVYLVGSLALGAFTKNASDVDFVTVVERTLTQQDIETLRSLHKQLAGRYPQWPLEGSYLFWADLGCLADQAEPRPCYHDGTLDPAGCFERNVVTWWLLKRYGIALLGPAPQYLPFQVETRQLCKYTAENLERYWRPWTEDRRRIAYLLTDAGIEWAVLGVARLWHTLREQDITSKLGAGAYGLSHLPARWHPLIQEALKIRLRTGERFYRSSVARAVDAVRFIKYIIAAANTRVNPPQ